MKVIARARAYTCEGARVIRRTDMCVVGSACGRVELCPLHLEREGILWAELGARLRVTLN